ncbi:hypothetical protein K6W36_12225 [Acetobacter senegalensis]|uniref:hypothetical protein n=1 Tax=Acetobacter senegalensis TaxID=446692 RepID=UPI001EDBFB6E|nr:hypothetical protein [Acetobacter senegalensis]MCG4261331.1 hypothetical protein [Acetobacter senegalensis]
MTNQPPTGVFVQLPLSDEQVLRVLDSYTGDREDTNAAMQKTFLAIGTPVTADVLYPVGYINEDAIGGLATGIYQSASIFRDEDKEHHDTVALVRLDVAEAKLAERDAEIARLRKGLSKARDAITSPHNAKSIVCTVWSGPAETLVDYIDAVLKGGAA